MQLLSQFGYVVNNHGDRKSPMDRVVSLPNGFFLCLINGGYEPLSKSTNSDDSPSIGQTWSTPPNQKDWMIQHVVFANLHDRKTEGRKVSVLGCFWYIYINKCVGRGYGLGNSQQQGTWSFGWKNSKKVLDPSKTLEDISGSKFFQNLVTMLF